MPNLALPSAPTATAPRSPNAAAKPVATAPQKTRIDWNAAKAFYVSLDTTERTFARVAREFRVSSVTVRKHAHADGWVALAENADRKAGEKALAQAERTREERAAANRRLLDKLDVQLERSVDAGDLEDRDAIRLRADAYRQYLLDIGEATDRISIPEVRDFVGRFVGSIDELLVAVLDDTLQNGKRQVVLRAFRERMPALLEQAATVEAGQT